jgi:hypothetical protein
VPPASGYVATVSRTGPWTRIRPSTDDERGIVAGCPQPEVGHPLRIDPCGPIEHMRGLNPSWEAVNPRCS